jgi:hypothetical protein
LASHDFHVLFHERVLARGKVHEGWKACENMTLRDSRKMLRTWPTWYVHDEHEDGSDMLALSYRITLGWLSCVWRNRILTARAGCLLES